jgi:hypothetical protein
VIGTDPQWYAGTKTGLINGTTPSSAFVFSSTAQVDGISYATNTSVTPFTLQAISYAAGETIANESVFAALEANSDSSTDSYLQLVGTSGPIYSSNGLPVVNLAAETGKGSFQLGTDNILDYNITSMNPVTATAAPGDRCGRSRQCVDAAGREPRGPQSPRSQQRGITADLLAN